MKLRIIYLLLLLLGWSFAATAQQKKHAKKAVTKTTAKKVVAKKVPAKNNKVAEAAAKDSVLKGATIEIIQSYKPEIKQAPKPEAVPGLPPVDTTTARVNMDVPPQGLNFTYNSIPLKPLALAGDSGMHKFKSYVKLGGGNLSTLMLDAGIASLKGKNYETAIRLHHLSQSGVIADQKTSLTGLEAEGNLHAKRHIWHADLGVLHHVYHYYGYDHSVYAYSLSSIKQAYSGVNIAIDMRNSNTDTKLSYNPSVKAGYYADNNGASEQKAGVALPFSYRIDTSLQLRIGIAGMYSGLYEPTVPLPRNSNLAQLLPGVDYHKGAFMLKAGLYPTIGQNNAYLLPDIKASFTITNTQLTVFAGWQGLLGRNTYEELSTRNPYLSNLYSLQQAHSNEVFGGLQTNIGSHISFSGKVSWWQYDSMPLMINDTLTDNKKFLLVYDKVNALSLQGSVRYHVADRVAIGFSAIYTNYNTTTSRRAWHEPGIRMNADLMVRPIRNLTVTAYLSAMDEIYALDKGNKAVKLNSIVDFGVGAEYNFMPRLSAFVNVNNIFNNQYERWYGYQAYGFNIFGGLRLKF